MQNATKFFGTQWDPIVFTLRSVMLVRRAPLATNVI